MAGPLGLRPSAWVVPPPSKTEGPRCREARRLLQCGSARAAVEGLLQEREGEDVLEGLNLVAFACSVASDGSCLQNFLREVARGGKLRDAHVEEAHLPELSRLVASILALEAPEGSVNKAKELVKPPGLGRLSFAKAVQRVAQGVRGWCGGAQERLRLGLGLLDERGPEGWPSVYALAHLLAGCALAGRPARRVAHALATRCRLGHTLQPGLLAFCEDLVGRQTSGLEGDTVQLAARWAAGSPTARHGAVLRRGGEVLSLGMNRQLQLATGRGVDMHAEVEALLRLPTRSAARGGEMWVVQLDGCGVGFCDARPCKGGCRQALQIFQIKQVTFTSKRPGELTCEPVAENPNVTSMSLAYLGRMGLGQSLPALEQACKYRGAVKPEAVQGLLRARS